MYQDANVCRILILAARYALRLMRVFFEGIARETVKLKGFDTDWAWPTFRLVLLLTIAFVSGRCVSLCPRIRI